MVWLFRFIMGLPARHKDLQEIKENFPEVIDDPRLILRFYFPLHFQHFGERLVSEIGEEFRGWLNLDRDDRTFEDTDSCPAENCPRRMSVKSIARIEAEPLLFLMRIGGDLKPPMNSFLDLVKTVHKGRKSIKQVILTDKYLFIDYENKGLESLKAYFNALNLERDSKFEILVNPKAQGDARRKKFESDLKQAFPGVRIRNFSRKYTFHDRFYLVKYDDGEIKGVFGPSLNGLSKTSIVLFGELERNRTIERLNQWFN